MTDQDEFLNIIGTDPPPNISACGRRVCIGTHNYIWDCTRVTTTDSSIAYGPCENCEKLMLKCICTANPNKLVCTVTDSRDDCPYRRRFGFPKQTRK